MFISSLSSMTTLSSKKTVPEMIISDPSAPSPMGYGQSKYVVEHLLNRISEESQGAISTAVLRVGQIAGPVKTTKGVWKTREWLPSLVISSQTAGALPDSLGRMDQVDWIPVDLLADSIGELLDNEQVWDPKAGRGYTTQCSVFHVINPASVPWAQLLPSLKAKLGMEKTVSLKDWIELVRQGPEEDSTTRRNPARKILQFYESLANTTDSESGSGQPRQRFELGNMARCSETFKHMRPVSEKWLDQWASQWDLG